MCQGLSGHPKYHALADNVVVTAQHIIFNDTMLRIFENISLEKDSGMRLLGKSKAPTVFGNAALQGCLNNFR